VSIRDQGKRRADPLKPRQWLPWAASACDQRGFPPACATSRRTSSAGTTTGNLAIDHEGTQYVIEDLTGGQITMQPNVGVASGTLCDMVATIGKQPAISLRRLQRWHSQVG
jgi:hypothetical protein